MTTTVGKETVYVAESIPGTNVARETLYVAMTQPIISVARETVYAILELTGAAPEAAPRRRTLILY